MNREVGLRLALLAGRRAGRVHPETAESVAVPLQGFAVRTGGRCRRVGVHGRQRRPRPARPGRAARAVVVEAPREPVAVSLRADGRPGDLERVELAAPAGVDVADLEEVVDAVGEQRVGHHQPVEADRSVGVQRFLEVMLPPFAQSEPVGAVAVYETKRAGQSWRDSRTHLGVLHTSLRASYLLAPSADAACCTTP